MSSPTPVTVEWTLNRRRPSNEDPTPGEAAGQECIPRLARLMALAIRFDALIRQGIVRDYADLARLGHVSRARITQIMNLLNLAPDIQEQVLDLPNRNSSVPSERDIRNITKLIFWRDQRREWQQIL